MAAVRIILCVILLVASMFFHARWKLTTDSDRYCGRVLRIFIGLAALIVLGAFIFGDIVLSLECAIVMFVLMIIPFVRFMRAGIYPLRYTLLALLASLGGFVRFILCCTLVFIPFNRLIDNLVSGRVYEYMLYRQAHPELSQSEPQETSSSSILFEMGKAYDEAKRESEQKYADSVRSRSKVEVYRRDGFFVNQLTVNDDGTMYWDPDDGEWKKIEKD